MDYTSCTLCPRRCHVNRAKTLGFCQAGTLPKIARAALHFWEEPCISGIRGSGAVFFSSCTLKCVYCQNYSLSHEGFGQEVSVRRLSEIFLELQAQGAHNINLVTATHYLPSVLAALELAKPSLAIPVVYNCGGYETPETIRQLSGYIDIYLPDFKYYDKALSKKYSAAEDYFSCASEAVKEMIRQTGSPRFQEKEPSLLAAGVILRHLVLPGGKEDSIRLLHWMKEELPSGSFLLSLMSQYTPCHQSQRFPEINRRVTTYEYEKVLDAAISLGLTQGYMQKRTSAREEFIPPFDLSGV